MICFRCQEECIFAKDELCKACRLRVYQVIKYPWTPEMDAQLTKLYRIAKNKPVLSKGLTELCRRFAYPRHVLSNRAQSLGLRTFHQNPWTKHEIAYLQEKAGSVSIGSMAKVLRRSYGAVKMKLSLLGLSGVRATGFSPTELAKLFGVTRSRIERWLARGWLAIDDGQIAQEWVERFAWEHMNEYRFASCDDWWIKTILNPKLGQIDLRGIDRRAA